MNKFLQNKLTSYFNTSNTPDLCMKYLRLNYPLNKVNLDHLAFRSIAIEDYHRIKNEILNNGYTKQETFEIPQIKETDIKKTATWFKHHELPRIFLSYGELTYQHQLIVESCFPDDMKYKYLTELGDDYPAWTYMWKDEINHVAIDMSNYDNFKRNIKKMQRDLSLKMNDKNGLYQVSKDKLLIQCSTKADIYHDVPKNYIEFVKRINGREGFEASNAYNIFKSTESN